MPVLEIGLEEIYKLIDQLDPENKMQIFERLKSQLLAQKWDTLFARIDKRVRQFPISEAEIAQEVERARKEFHSGSGS